MSGMKAIYGATIALMFIVHLEPRRGQAQWVNPPSKEALKNTPGLIHRTFESAAMKTTVGYCVVLPAGYEDSQQRYPVIYWLHGGGGNESSSLFTAQGWRELQQSRRIEPVIIVYPAASRSGYMDHFDGKVMVETMILRELIPLIDKSFRTIAGRRGRAVHGFSMGASGALKFAIKHPHIFASAVAGGGGAINLETTKDAWILDILKRNLNSDPELVRQNNTYHFLDRNSEIVRENGTRFLLVCGGADKWKESAMSFQQALKSKSIPWQLVIVPKVGHNARRIYKSAGKRIALFQDEVFKQTLKRR